MKRQAQNLDQNLELAKGYGIMNITKLPTSRKVLSTFRTYCTDGGQVAQMVVHFANFQVQARKRGGLGWVTLGLGCFMYVHILERGV